jgi:hypothetical protein
VVGRARSDKPKKDPKVVKQKQFEAAKETIKNFVQMSSFRGQLNSQINAVYGSSGFEAAAQVTMYTKDLT